MPGVFWPVPCFGCWVQLGHPARAVGVFRGGRACEGLAAGVETYPDPAPPGPGARGDALGRAPPGSRLSVRAKNLRGCPRGGGAGPERRGLRGHTAGAGRPERGERSFGPSGDHRRAASGSGARGGWCVQQGRQPKENPPSLFSVEKTKRANPCSPVLRENHPEPYSPSHAVQRPFLHVYSTIPCIGD